MAAGRSELGAPRLPGDRSPIELVIYPGVHHGSDPRPVPCPHAWRDGQGHRVEFNEDATKKAIVAVRDFLLRTIGVP